MALSLGVMAVSMPSIIYSYSAVQGVQQGRSLSFITIAQLHILKLARWVDRSFAADWWVWLDITHTHPAHSSSWSPPPSVRYYSYSFLQSLNYIIVFNHTHAHQSQGHILNNLTSSKGHLDGDFLYVSSIGTRYHIQIQHP